ncbi:MAG: trypsin-like peptidase domain-containing protein [Phaeodactylibacter sp.]|nr:trypsin-like peptidase domain-containing protein [Phaeodactylibacter sp.]
MKQILSLVFAGLIGGCVAIGGLYLFQQDTNTFGNAPAKKVRNINIAPDEENAPSSFTEAAARAMPSVVHIAVTESVSQVESRRNDSDPFRFFFGQDFSSPFDGLYQPRSGTGSGVIYTEDGYIVTNNHVVEMDGEIEVTLYDNRKFKAQVVGTYPKSDLAVIKIDARDLPTLDIADSDEAQIGEWVLAVGNPLNLTSTVTAGIVSAKGRDINIINGQDAIESFIQTDAAVNPGNSGGALVDTKGRLLGINTAISTHTGFFEGYSFAIPVNIMTKVVDDIIEYGSYQRGWLGVSIFELDAEYATEQSLDLSQGVVIESVADGGSAQFAGLLPKDVIIAVDSRAIKTVPELQEVIGRSKVGETITVTVLRNGKEEEIPVRLKAAG